MREETFVTETDAAASDYKDPVSGKPLKQMKESSYFFKQSKCASRAALVRRGLRGAGSSYA